MTDERWRTTNLGTLLFAASGRAVAVKLAAVHAAGFTDLTAAHLALFLALDRTGTRGWTTLAARARLSKPSMAELVDRAVAGGLVERRVDAGDRRVRIVVPTPAGGALLAAIEHAIAAADRDIAAVLGDAAAARLRHRLGRYVAARGGSDPAWVAANAARALALAAAAFVAEVAGHVAAAGFAVTPALLGMVRHVELGGSRLTDLAARARMTKPAMRELVDRGVALGFVVRRPDPTDRRAAQVAFTARGQDLLTAARHGVLAAEGAAAAAIGEGLADVRGQLVALYRGRWQGCRLTTAAMLILYRSPVFAIARPAPCLPYARCRTSAGGKPGTALGETTMRHRWLGASAVVAPLLALAAAASAQTAFEATAATGTSSGEVAAPNSGEIIVTAQKRAENLQKVPIVITAVSGAQLTTAGVTQPDEPRHRRPRAQRANHGRIVQPVDPRRQHLVENMVENPIALYIDGVYLPQQREGARDLPDIEQEDRRPQGSAGNAVRAQRDRQHHADYDLQADRPFRFQSTASIDNYATFAARPSSPAASPRGSPAACRSMVLPRARAMART